MNDSFYEMVLQKKFEFDAVRATTRYDDDGQ